MLLNKKVLFIAPSFFGYEDDIRRELELLGAQVDYFDERPFTSSFAKIVNRLDFKFFIKKNIDEHFRAIVKKSELEVYDFLFVISPETLDSHVIDSIKKVNPSIVSILYMWDSFHNKENARKLLPHFDDIISFDSRDKTINASIRFLPLFYNKDFESRSDKLETSYDFDVSFIGTVHSDRVKLVKKIFKQAEANNLKTFSFYYCPSKLLFWLKKTFTKELNHISYSEVSFKPMCKNAIRNIFMKSKCVIDIQHPEQSGLTMRSIEMLGLQRKVLTTNHHVKSYDFFDGRNILVIDRINPKVPTKFICSNYIVPNENVVFNYSLNSWIKSIFNIN
ncbi:hypothetical protein [Shewanella nanhaiensis]|uniref:Capsular biosynthesis protein CpsH n=1 Tax=Shewanella nanhaiensis TaxID=2864872 RepID=A0ABS7E696_9GAMM|nr:hypothetical protein [Shewanella nanhaiensis]MBW8185211.1 hypothetical protein [Shewanella nanhaiensis]